MRDYCFSYSLSRQVYIPMSEMRWLLSGLYLATALVLADGSERKIHHVQHGPCSYTFLLPEVGHCSQAGNFQVSNSLQRDSPPRDGGPSGPAEMSQQQKRLETLQTAMENNTQWLQKLENFIQETVRPSKETERGTMETQTAAMLEIGNSLLSQSAEQTRKLTDVETQVMNQTTRLEVQLLEYAVSTSKLEKQILQQTQQISRLNDKNSLLEQRFTTMEARHAVELQTLLAEKLQLQVLLAQQARLVALLQARAGGATTNGTLPQHQQGALESTMQKLHTLLTHCNEISAGAEEESPSFRDCGEIYKSGIKKSGVYSLRLPNSTETFKVFCDMETRGGGWTLLQVRRDGSLDFHRTWLDYKTVSDKRQTVQWALMGFGECSGEHWIGNDFIHQLTTSQDYTLQVHLKDREGNEAYSQYDHFYIEGEDQNYSLHARGFSGTAGRTSSMAHSGTHFSTKDRDNDRCSCKCAQMSSGGWWFDACGPSNLNGIYYSGRHNVLRFNGIKWYYWKGLNMMATSTAMMVRPATF